MFNYNGNLYAVGVGDFIAYKGEQLVAVGKVNTETSFSFSSSNLDIRGGKRAPLLLRYNHSSEASFNIISAAYNPDIWRASSGGKVADGSNGVEDHRKLSFEEALTIPAEGARTVTLTHTPVVCGDLPANVWVRYNGMTIGVIRNVTSRTITIPSDEGFEVIPAGAKICVVYNYQNSASYAVTIPAEIQPEIWHIFIDVDVATDKSGSGIVGRTIIEIPLAQLDPAQEFNATVDGYSSSNITGMMLADKNGNGCGNGGGVYAYINTELFDRKWYDNVYRIVNDIDDVEVSTNGSYTLSLIGLEVGGTYQFLGTDTYGTADGISFVFSAGTATGSTFNSTTGVFTAGATAGTATVTVTCPSKPAIPAYVLEINVVSA